jgi:uncharacterized protein YjbI with pentapeptide repeats
MSPFTREQVLELLQSNTSLAGIDLSGANLEAINLGGVNLNHANLWGARLTQGVRPLFVCTDLKWDGEYFLP